MGRKTWSEEETINYVQGLDGSAIIFICLYFYFKRQFQKLAIINTLST
jgi:hypothetical protein